MITPKSRIRRILKHLNGYSAISTYDFKSCLPREDLLVDEEPVAVYRDPYSSDGHFILFTDKRLFVKKPESVACLPLADLKSVVGPKEKETASSLKLYSKEGQCFTLTINGSDRRIRPVFEFLRLFDRLINDMSGNASR